MLKCWKILVPIKMVGGYEEIIASLEKQARQVKLINYQVSRGETDAGCDAEGRVQTKLYFQFKPL
jgi:hypothetical protein